MDQLQNPYAAPLSSGPVDAAPGSYRTPRRHPWISRMLSVLLLGNALAFFSLFALLFVVGIYESRVPAVEPPNAVWFAFLLCGTWLVFAWPVVSLAALIYTPIVDRGTPRWMIKTIVAGLMVASWFGLCLLGLFA